MHLILHVVSLLSELTYILDVLKCIHIPGVVFHTLTYIKINASLPRAVDKRSSHAFSAHSALTSVTSPDKVCS